MSILVCKRVSFCSEQDELLMFEWIRRIKAVNRTEGKGDSIVLHTKRQIPARDLRELLALFYRYEIDMKQLAQFVTPKNRRWLARPSAF